MSCSISSGSKCCFKFDDDVKTLKCVAGVCALTTALVFSSGHYINMLSDFALIFTIAALAYSALFKETPKEFDPFDETEETEFITQESINSCGFAFTGYWKEILKAGTASRMKLAGTMAFLGFCFMFVSTPYIYLLGMLSFIAVSYLKQAKGVDVCEQLKAKAAPLVEIVKGLLEKVPQYSRKKVE